MSFNGSYKCSSCGTVKQSRDELVAKKVMFQQLGIAPRTMRSRTTAWLCSGCLVLDPDWNQPKYASPGIKTMEENLRG